MPTRTKRNINKSANRQLSDRERLFNGKKVFQHQPNLYPGQPNNGRHPDCTIPNVGVTKQCRDYFSTISPSQQVEVLQLLSTITNHPQYCDQSFDYATTPIQLLDHFIAEFYRIKHSKVDLHLDLYTNNSRELLLRSFIWHHGPGMHYYFLDIKTITQSLRKTNRKLYDLFCRFLNICIYQLNIPGFYDYQEVCTIEYFEESDQCDEDIFFYDENNSFQRDHIMAAISYYQNHLQDFSNHIANLQVDPYHFIKSLNQYSPRKIHFQQLKLWMLNVAALIEMNFDFSHYSLSTYDPYLKTVLGNYDGQKLPEDYIKFNWSEDDPIGAMMHAEVGRLMMELGFVPLIKTNQVSKDNINSALTTEGLEIMNQFMDWWSQGCKLSNNFFDPKLKS